MESNPPLEFIIQQLSKVNFMSFRHFKPQKIHNILILYKY
jgi:hypothetical protein